jgi:ankyrin repeat protein
MGSKMLGKYDVKATKELKDLLDSPTYSLTEFQELIKRNANPNIVRSINGATPAIIVAEDGHAKTLELLIKAGAKVDIQDQYGGTAAMRAAWGGHTQALELLVNAGAKVNIQDQYGATAAMWAAAKGHTKGLELLIKAGADINMKNKNGNTALDCAIMDSHAPAISLLVGKEVVDQKAMEACGAPKKAGLFGSNSYKTDDLRTLAALKLDEKPLSEVLGHIAAKHKNDLQKAYTSYLTSGKDVDDKVAKMVEVALNTKYEKTKGSLEAEMGKLNLQKNPMEENHKHGSSISSAKSLAEDKLTGGASQDSNPIAAKAVKAAGQALVKDEASTAVEVGDKVVSSLLKGFKKPAPVKGPSH